MAGALRSPAGRALITVFAAAVVGRVLLERLPSLNPAFYVLAAPVAFALVVLVLRGPHVALTLVVVGTVFGATEWAVAAGGVDLRATDVGYAAVVAWAVSLRSAGAAPRPSHIGQRAVAVFLVCLGIGLLPVLAGDGRDIALLVSFLRFVQTMSLVWLVPSAVRTAGEREFVLRAFVIAASAELSWALLSAEGSVRLQGHLGPNAGGLVAVLLLLAVLHARVPANPVLRAATGAVAVFALVQSASIASITAAGVALGVFGWRTRPRDEASERALLLRPARVMLLLISVVGVIALVRPQDLPTSSSFQSSSTAQRTVVGYAGLAIFADNPIVGVGWGRSASQEVIGTPELNERLRERFSEVDRGLFPDQYTTNVHNAYVQVLADAGILGVGGLLVAIAGVAPRVRRLVRRADGRDYVVARFATMAVVVVMVWWNDNPLFGAQPESVLFAFFLGLLGSIPRRLDIGESDDASGPVVATTPADDRESTAALR